VREAATKSDNPMRDEELQEAVDLNETEIDFETNNGNDTEIEYEAPDEITDVEEPNENDIEDHDSETPIITHQISKCMAQKPVWFKDNVAGLAIDLQQIYMSGRHGDCEIYQLHQPFF
jgi:hypothetical protein